MSEARIGEGSCPLCGSPGVRPFVEAHGRSYLDCRSCGLIHLAPSDRLDPESEREQYRWHRNDPADGRYREFLDRLCGPLARKLQPVAEGLDYGSGPGPTLSVMLEERGFPVRIYDPFFAPDRSALARSYDFVTCTETAEHFFNPRAEFALLERLLRPGGWLGVMTQLYLDDRPFAGWRYAREPTHVSFYRRRTMTWIASHFGWTLEMPRKDVALFQKPRRAENGAER